MKINLEKIFKQEFKRSNCYLDYDSAGLECIKSAMKKACKKALKLAAKEAYIPSMCSSDDIISKQSIIDVINLID